MAGATGAPPPGTSCLAPTTWRRTSAQVRVSLPCAHMAHAARRTRSMRLLKTAAARAVLTRTKNEHARADGALLQLWSMHCEDALRAASARSTRRNARLDNVRSKVQSLSRPGSQSSARAPAAAQPQQQPSTSLDGSAPPPGSVSSPAPSTPDAGRARAATNEALRKSADSALLPGGGALKVSSPSSPLSQQQRPGTALASPVGLGGGRGAASSSPQAPPQRPGTSEGPRGLAAATAPLLPAARLSGSGGTAAPPPGSAALRRAYDARISTHRGYLNGVDVPDARVLQLDDATMMQVCRCAVDVLHLSPWRRSRTNNRCCVLGGCVRAGAAAAGAAGGSERRRAAGAGRRPGRRRGPAAHAARGARVRAALLPRALPHG